MCKFINLHTEVDNNVEGTRFQPRRRTMYYRGIFYKALVKESKAKSLPGIYRGVSHGPISIISNKPTKGTYRGINWSTE